MPIYEYTCAACGKTTEIIMLKSSSKGRLECGACGSAKLRKQISAAAIPRVTSSAACKTCSGADSTCPGAGSCCGN